MSYNDEVDKLLKPYKKITRQEYLDELLKNFCLVEIEHGRLVHDSTYDESTQSKTIFEFDVDTQQTKGTIITFNEQIENIFMSENKKSKATIDTFYKSLSKGDADRGCQFYNYLQNSIKEVLNTTNTDVLEKYPFINECLVGIKTNAKRQHQKIFGTIKSDNSQNSLHIHHDYLNNVDNINQILDSDALKIFYRELGGFRNTGGYINCARIDRFKKIFKNEPILYPIIWNNHISGLTLLIEKLISANVISTESFSSNNQGLWQTVAKCFVDKEGKKIALAKFNTRNSNDDILIEIINDFIENLTQEFQAAN